MGKGISLIICCLFLSGCATTRSANPDVQSMQSRIDFLESEINAKDQEIGSMRSQLKQANRNYAANEDYEVSVNKNKSTIRTLTKNNEYKEIIKVDGVTAEKVQTALKNAGFYNGDIDGKIGPKTKDAIKAFQRDNSLTVDGVIGRGTWSKLKTNL
jgi:murein L,D-transpeptidase YcbB/YkuD